MTGFAAINREDELAAIGVTIRSVNHRYLDLQIRVPQSLAALEARVRGQAQQYVGRGRVEVVVTLQVRQTPRTDVELNEQLVVAMVEAFDRARRRGLIEGGLTAGDLLRFPQSLAIRERASETDEAAWSQLSEAVVAAVEEAFRQLDRMRARERPIPAHGSGRTSDDAMDAGGPRGDRRGGGPGGVRGPAGRARPGDDP